MKFTYKLTQRLYLSPIQEESPNNEYYSQEPNQLFNPFFQLQIEQTDNYQIILIAKMTIVINKGFIIKKIFSDSNIILN